MGAGRNPILKSYETSRTGNFVVMKNVNSSLTNTIVAVELLLGILLLTRLSMEAQLRQRAAV